MEPESFSFVVGLVVGAFVVTAVYEAMYWRKIGRDANRPKR